MAYLKTECKDTNHPAPTIKIGLHCELIDDEKSQQHPAAERLACDETEASPMSASLASMALQGKQKTVELLKSCGETYVKVPKDELVSLRYVPLDFATIHIHMFSAGSFPTCWRGTRLFRLFSNLLTGTSVATLFTGSAAVQPVFHLLQKIVSYCLGRSSLPPAKPTSDHVPARAQGSFSRPVH